MGIVVFPTSRTHDLAKNGTRLCFETEDSVIPNENKHKGSRLVSIVVGWEF